MHQAFRRIVVVRRGRGSSTYDLPNIAIMPKLDLIWVSLYCYQHHSSWVLVCVLDIIRSELQLVRAYREADMAQESFIAAPCVPLKKHPVFLSRLPFRRFSTDACPSPPSILTFPQNAADLCY